MCKLILLLTILSGLTIQSNSQVLKKLGEKVKDKVEQKSDAKVDKKIDQALDNALEGKAPEKSMEKSTETIEPGTEKNTVPQQSKKPVYNSKFDFVPGTNILYFDNFENDNIGETPEGWITSTFAETVTIDELEGRWLKLTSTNSRHITRNKKQSWGNNFSVEFDLLIVKNTYSPRIEIALINTGGKLVTDEGILGSSKQVINFYAILNEGNSSRVSLYAMDKILSDVMNETLPCNNMVPVHISMCVQGKRFRMWWNDRKLYDLTAVSEEYLPNQLEFSFSSVGGADFFVSNIRVAKDIPDTRARFAEGKLVSNLLFYAGTANLKPESMGSLLDVSKILKEYNTPVKIVGHTDSDGDAAFNQKLSEQRANEVKKILETVYQVDKSLLTTEGRGEIQPIADNNTLEGKAQNRRVEFIFKPEADQYRKPAGAADKSAAPVASNNKSTADKGGSSSTNASGSAQVTLQSKILNASLPHAQFMKTADNRYTFMASKEEGNSKENFIKIVLESVSPNLKPDTYNFKEINQKNALYGTKKYPEIINTEAVLYYGTEKKPYIKSFSPIIANGHMSTYVDEGLIRNLPEASPNCKFVIEKIVDGKASGYFTFGILVEGLKPVKKGEAMQETFTTGFSGELKSQFSNVPIY